MEILITSYKFAHLYEYEHEALSYFYFTIIVTLRTFHMLSYFRKNSQLEVVRCQYPPTYWELMNRNGHPKSRADNFTSILSNKVITTNEAVVCWTKEKPHTKTKKQKMSYNTNPLYLNKERTNICIRKPRKILFSAEITISWKTKLLNEVKNLVPQTKYLNCNWDLEIYYWLKRNSITILQFWTYE